MSLSRDNTILETINSIIDKNDPTQRVLALIASLVDTRLKQFSSENSEQHTNLLDKINEISTEQESQYKQIEALENLKKCPLGMDIKLEDTRKELAVVLFFSDYPKLSIIMLVGLTVLSGLGVDKVVEIAKNVLEITSK